MGQTQVYFYTYLVPYLDGADRRLFAVSRKKYVDALSFRYSPSDSHDFVVATKTQKQNAKKIIYFSLTVCVRVFYRFTVYSGFIAVREYIGIPWSRNFFSYSVSTLSKAFASVTLTINPLSLNDLSEYSKNSLSSVF